MTDSMPEDMPDRISNRMPNRMPEDAIEAHQLMATKNWIQGISSKSLGDDFVCEVRNCRFKSGRFFVVHMNPVCFFAQFEG